MSIDTSNIDIKSVIDQLACIAWQKPVRSHGETVYKGGPCPFCQQGTDRFAVFPESEKPHFYCGIHGNGCGAHGDVISFVQQIKGYTSVNLVIQELQAMGFQVGNERVGDRLGRNYRPYGWSERDKPGQQWQDQGNALVHAAQTYLWSSVGKEALDYLHGRGLTDETILRFRLGYWPKWTEYKPSDWGLKGEGTFWIRPGILIPCYAKDGLWSINQRITEYTSKEREQLAHGKQLPRYRQVKGSGNALFNVDAIQAEEPLFVTEGEIDAMTIIQATDCNAVATGSTQGARITRWIASLAVASRLLIAFDNDGGKGEKSAEYWTKTIFPRKAFYWPPWAKDVNEMLQRGQDINSWASRGIELVLSSPVVESSSPATDRQEHGDYGRPQGPPLRSLPPDPLNFCSVCHGEVETFTDDGTPYCQACCKTLSAPDDPLNNPVVREIVRLFNATIITDPHVQKMPPYHPVTLPALPRARCPHKVLVESKGRYMKSQLCCRLTLAHGWCEDHAVSAQFLALGAQLNYPALDLSVYRSVGAGIAQWEVYAEIFDKNHLESDCFFLYRMISTGA